MIYILEVIVIGVLLRSSGNVALLMDEVCQIELVNPITCTHRVYKLLDFDLCSLTGSPSLHHRAVRDTIVCIFTICLWSSVQ